DARGMVRHYYIYLGVGGLSVVLTLANIGTNFGAPGWVYVLLGPLCGYHGVWTNRRRGALEPGRASS
ncbi:MAG: hypothetical protein AAFY88_32355, partial [Acidobacteriota bacterium]